MDKKLLKDLEEKIKKIAPFKAVVFGSQAREDANNDSDLDLLIVTNKETFPKNFKEKNRDYLDVNYHLRDLYKEIPIDLIVYSKKEYERLKELKSNFINEIDKNGKVIYG